MKNFTHIENFPEELREKNEIYQKLKLTMAPCLNEYLEIFIEALTHHEEWFFEHTAHFYGEINRLQSLYKIESDSFKQLVDNLKDVKHQCKAFLERKSVQDLKDTINNRLQIIKEQNNTLKDLEGSFFSTIAHGVKFIGRTVPADLRQNLE